MLLDSTFYLLLMIGVPTLVFLIYSFSLFILYTLDEEEQNYLLIGLYQQEIKRLEDQVKFSKEYKT